MMDTPIETIRRFAPEANSQSDQMNRIIRLVEEFLKEECSIGLPVFEASSLATLSYIRIDGNFHICVDGRQWGQVPRKYRTKAFLLLPKLLEGIALAAQTEVKNADKITSIVASVGEALDNPER